MGLGSKLKSAAKSVGGLAGGALGVGGGLLGLLDVGAEKDQGRLKQDTIRDSRTETNRVEDLRRTEQRDRTATASALGEQDTDDLRAILAQVTGQLTGSIPTGVDFDAIREAALTGVMQQGIGDVISQGTNAGAYAGTPQATAAERLGAQAAVVGTQAETQARLQQQQQLQDAVANFTNILKGAQTTETATDKAVTDEQKRINEISENRSLESVDQKTKGTKYDVSTPEKSGGGGLSGVIGNLFGL